MQHSRMWPVCCHHYRASELITCEAIAFPMSSVSFDAIQNLRRCITHGQKCNQVLLLLERRNIKTLCRGSNQRIIKKDLLFEKVVEKNTMTNTKSVYCANDFVFFSIAYPFTFPSQKSALIVTLSIHLISKRSQQ